MKWGKSTDKQSYLLQQLFIAANEGRVASFWKWLEVFMSLFRKFFKVSENFIVLGRSFKITEGFLSWLLKVAKIIYWSFFKISKFVFRLFNFFCFKVAKIIFLFSLSHIIKICWFFKVSKILLLWHALLGNQLWLVIKSHTENVRLRGWWLGLFKVSKFILDFWRIVLNFC